MIVLTRQQWGGVPRKFFSLWKVTNSLLFLSSSLMHFFISHFSVLWWECSSTSHFFFWDGCLGLKLSILRILATAQFRWGVCYALATRLVSKSVIKSLNTQYPVLGAGGGSWLLCIKQFCWFVICEILIHTGICEKIHNPIQVLVFQFVFQVLNTATWCSSLELNTLFCQPLQ